MKRREENSVRVTNLSEDTREDDLRVRLCQCCSCLAIAWKLGPACMKFSDDILISSL